MNKNAEKQAKFKNKKRADGFVQKTVWVKKEDFDFGVRAHKNNTPMEADLNNLHVVSFFLGYSSQLAKKLDEDLEQQRLDQIFVDMDFSSLLGVD